MRHYDATIDRSRFNDLDSARQLEWMVANGRGGYAMASVTGLLTRRYHGLLVAAVKPPIERFVLLAKLDATVSINGLTYELASNDYPETVHPRGYRLLERFAARPFPTWTWRLGDAVVEQTLCMARGEDTTFVRYRLIEGPDDVRLSIRPLCTSRHYHRLTNYKTMGPPTADVGADDVTFHWGGGRPPWRLSHNGRFKSKPDWYYDFVLGAEAARGLDSRQDLFMPGVVNATVKRGDGEGLVIAATTEKASWRDAGRAFSAATETAPLVRPGGKEFADDPLIGPLAAATSDFVVARAGGSRTVIAGYPWFGDWGRDTFISLPGLCLVTGRFDDARDIIRGYVQYVDAGMIPNRFPPFNEPPGYNTVDATLWYLHAIDRYLAYTDDWEFVADTMYPVITSILEAHEGGTRHGIGLCDDGLLTAGTEGLQLTWMDAKVNDWVVTPRIGKPVEINALWFNALRIGALFAERIGDRARGERWASVAEKCRASFNARFWNEAAGCLFDVVDVDHRSGVTDACVRPNQVFAVSLPYPVLDRSRWPSVVDVCRRLLWTPMGMRTLVPDDGDYCPRYSGDMAARDAAYHRGSVWPWLLGPFVTAFVRVRGEGATAEARSLLAGLESHVSDAGLGGISEVADGDPPHGPGGCPWQAWSVAEPLRALCEDIYKTHPVARARPAASGPQPNATGSVAPAQG